MKKKIKVCVISFLLFIFLAFASLIIFITNPTLLYSRESIYKNFTVYHDEPINLWLIVRLDQAIKLLETNELYDPNFKYTLCLNNNSAYPKLIKLIQGEEFGWAFYHFIVLNGNINFEQNYTELRSFKWNLTQLIVHEAMHCQLYNTFGLWKSNPAANIHNWKWEGYPEFIARKKADQTDLLKNIERLNTTQKSNHKGWVYFADGTGTGLQYYKNWLLVQFCMNIKHLTFVQLIHNQQAESDLTKEMMEWYSAQKNTSGFFSELEE